MRNVLAALLLLLVSLNRVIANEEISELEIQKLTDNVYVHTSYQVFKEFGLVDSNRLVVIVGNNAYIVDTPWSAADTEDLLLWIKEHGFTPKASVSTHFMRTVPRVSNTSTRTLFQPVLQQ